MTTESVPYWWWCFPPARYLYSSQQYARADSDVRWYTSNTSPSKTDQGRDDDNDILYVTKGTLKGEGYIHNIYIHDIYCMYTTYIQLDHRSLHVTPPLYLRRYNIKVWSGLVTPTCYIYVDEERRRVNYCLYGLFLSSLSFSSHFGRFSTITIMIDDPAGQGPCWSNPSSDLPESSNQISFRGFIWVFQKQKQFLAKRETREMSMGSQISCTGFLFSPCMHMYIMCMYLVCIIAIFNRLCLLW